MEIDANKYRSLTQKCARILMTNAVFINLQTRLMVKIKKYKVKNGLAF